MFFSFDRQKCEVGVCRCCNLERKRSCVFFSFWPPIVIDQRVRCRTKAGLSSLSNLLQAKLRVSAHMARAPLSLFQNSLHCYCEQAIGFNGLEAGSMSYTSSICHENFLSSEGHAVAKSGVGRGRHIHHHHHWGLSVITKRKKNGRRRAIKPLPSVTRVADVDSTLFLRCKQSRAEPRVSRAFLFITLSCGFRSTQPCRYYDGI